MLNQPTETQAALKELEQIRADVEEIKARLMHGQDMCDSEIVGDPVDYCPNCGYEITPGLKSPECSVCD